MKKTKTCKGWKVLLAKSRRSISDYSLNNKYALEYPVNVIVFPKLEGSKLFFFRSKKCAIEFMADFYATGDYQPKMVVRCIATNPQKKLTVSDNIMNIEAFWSGNICYINNAPEGTYVANSITCLE